MLGRNVVLAGGELDLVIGIDGLRVAVEVKTSTVDLYDAAERFDTDKQDRVVRIGRAAGCRRIDLVTIYLAPTGYFLRWIPNAG